MAEMRVGWGYGSGERARRYEGRQFGQMADHMEVRAWIPAGRHRTSGCRGAIRQPGSGFPIVKSTFQQTDSVPRLGKCISIEGNGRLVNVDNAPTNVPGLEGHRVCEIENAASRRGGLPIAGPGVADRAVDQEATGTALLNYQTFGLVGPGADGRGRGLCPGGLDAHYAQHHACKSQAKCVQRDEPSNAFHFLQYPPFRLMEPECPRGDVTLPRLELV